jgi:hypothetical protein
VVDLSISEGHITIDPMDTRYFCAAVSYYNDIYKITTEVRSDGPGLENQRAEVSTKIEALETVGVELYCKNFRSKLISPVESYTTAQTLPLI